MERAGANFKNENEAKKWAAVKHKRNPKIEKNNEGWRVTWDTVASPILNNAGS